MRMFEILLFLSNVCLLVEIFLMKNRATGSTLIFTSTASLAFLIIQLFAEGYRFQLLFLYCFTVFLFIFSIISYRKVPVSRQPSNVKRLLASFFVIAALLVTACLMYVFPVFTLPKPTGTFKVGTQVFDLIDQSSNETLDKSASGKRELMVQVWYPALNTTGKPIPFIPDTQILDPMAENYGLPGFTFEYLKYVLSHSYKNADASAAQNTFPLILINPGFGSSRFLHTSQAEDLASHGYIVAVIDHTYNTFATVFPDGRITTCKSNEFFSPKNDYQTETGNRDKVGKVLTDDVTFILDEFQLINSGLIQSKLKGKIALTHIGILGHSIGGATAYDSSYDPRITAGIDLDGALYRLRKKSGLNKPFLFICSEGGYEDLKNVMNNHVYTNEELKLMGNTREWMDNVTKDKKVEIELMGKVAKSGGQILYIENSEHLNFTDSQFFSPIFKLFGATGNINPQRADTVVNAYILDFFNKYLKSGNGSLITEPNNRFPEVKFITSLFTSRGSK